jgi:hypothetical protein
MPPRIRLPNCALSSTASKHIQVRGSAAPSIRAYMSQPQPSFSKGTADVDSLRERLNPLLATNGGRWALADGGEALERTFRFKTFAKTWVSLVSCLSCFDWTFRAKYCLSGMQAFPLPYLTDFLCNYAICTFKSGSSTYLPLPGSKDRMG